MFKKSILTTVVALISMGLYAQSNLPHPAKNPDSPLMLAGDWVPEDTHQIDFDKLPRLPGLHMVVNDVRHQMGVNQHNYLDYYDGKYWIMWSDGPGIEDRVGQRVKFATSTDGVLWSEPRYLTPNPPGAERAGLYGTRSDRGFRYIARGFWQRDGEFLALASLDEAAGFFGPSLELRAFRYDKKWDQWEDIGVVQTNAINNFSPKKIPTGEWMISRRKHDYTKSGVEFLVGGIESISSWKSYPVLGSANELAAEEPYWWVLPDNNLVALFRDNKGSGYLFRSFSTDNGRTWSTPVRTNFPDARSKFSGTRLKDGRYVLVSNANPKKRDPLVLSISDDGIIFNKMYYLVGGRHVDYPHVMEHDGHIFVAFASGKQTVEVIKIRLSDIDSIEMIPQK
ncbi:MAG: exo-alpha-sialidase [Spirosomataceae bacterium]